MSSEVVEAKESSRRMLSTARFIPPYFLVSLAFPLVFSAYLLFTGATLAWAIPAMAVAVLCATA